MDPLLGAFTSLLSLRSLCVAVLRSIAPIPGDVVLSDVSANIPKQLLNRLFLLNMLPQDLIHDVDSKKWRRNPPSEHCDKHQ